MTNDTKLLDGKVAVVYGAGVMGVAAARSFAREGARVFLASRGPAVHEHIETDRVDALDEAGVEAHADAVVARAGRIDVSFNAIGIRGDLQGTPLVEMDSADYQAPIALGTTTHFLTARAAARRMIPRRAGVILLLTATASWSGHALRRAYPMGGFGVACAAIEGLTRSLASELGPSGIRVACLRSEGVAEGFGDGRSALRDVIEGDSMLRRLPTAGDVGDVAALLASDRAALVTGAVINVSGGAVVV